MRRLVSLLGWSVALHLLAWLIVSHWPEQPPRPKPPPKPIEITVVETPPPPATAPMPPPPRKRRPIVERRTKEREIAEAPRPSPQAPPTEDRPSSVNPTKPSEISAPDQGGRSPTEGGDEKGIAERARGVRLFDPGALGKVIAPQGSPSAHAPELIAESQKRQGAAAEEARVGARLDGWLDEAMREGQVRGGLISECADGLDQGMDDEIDCAAPGCQMLPFCQGTQVLQARVGQAIPDDDMKGVESFIDVPAGGTVRAISIKLAFSHPQPGDLAVVLEAPDGKSTIVRRADRSERAFARAFWIRGFAGHAIPGRWKLKVIDALPGSTGQLQSWQLVVTG